jgi:Tfp pilus assembly protein PilF
MSHLVERVSRREIRKVRWPNSNALWNYWSGVVLAVNKDAAGAEKQLRKASELAPDDWRHLERLGELLFKNARYAEAAEVWKKALAIVPDNAALHRFIGGAEQMQGRYEEAITHLQKALEIDPSAPVYNNLGTLRFLLGRYADAVPAFEKAVELRAGSYLYWGNLGDARRWAPGLRSKSADAYARAIQLAQAELKNKPTAELRSRLGLYLAKSGQSDAARHEVAALASETKPAALLFRVAVAQELTGQRQAALESLNRAIRAGYAIPEIDGEPELTELRGDKRYGIMVATSPRSNTR